MRIFFNGALVSRLAIFKRFSNVIFASPNYRVELINPRIDYIGDPQLSLYFFMRTAEV
jgi:hypothetical protein